MNDTDTRHPLRVLALTHNHISEPCTFVRIFTPLQTLESTGRVAYTVQRLMPWSVMNLRHTLRHLHEWDVIWMARPRHYTMLPLIRRAHALGKPILIDIDDWLLDVPAEHVDADFYRTRPLQETVYTALRTVDAVTTSTEAIAERCAALGVRAHLLPNAIDCTQFRRQERSGETTTIAFCGTSSHYEDVPLIVPALRQLLEQDRHRVRVVSVGCPIPGLEDCAEYSHHAFVDAPQYPQFMSDLRIDIGLAPLHDTAFNRAKSDVKYLEYSATGAATIASPVAPYRASIHEDRGLLVSANTPEAWTATIFRLVQEPDLRQRLATSAYEWVRNERSIEATADMWFAIFDDYANAHVPSAPPGARQLDAGRFERVLANIVVRQTPYDAIQLRDRLVQTIRAATYK